MTRVLVTGGRDCVRDFIARLKRLPCTCRGRAPTEPLQKGYRFVWRDWLGVTMGWSCQPEIAVASGYECEACGAVYETTGGYIPRLGKRDTTGWPLTLSGERMPLEQDRIYREREWPTRRAKAAGIEVVKVEGGSNNG
ncbi:hypothetical protein HCU64_06370 [Methylobacterium sp. C25]|uniref:hypothetical protein n=1 Tax=Methylobacterium sp. C25 TaxID=2721622 RepID=UPI001F1E2EFB|nr:hypothetical protein [Methylobacterium sp. C25]MCE4223370.1 hypothetical protein [Methylobacterium sp. C25]